MNDITNYQLEDFLLDPDFRDWVWEGAFQNPDSHWSFLLEQFPHKKRLASRARQILLASNIEEAPFPEDYFINIEEQVLTKVSKQRRSYAYFTYGIAAAVALFLLAGGWWWLGSKKEISPEPAFAGHSSRLQDNEAPLRSSNTTLSVIPVALPDGSSILLHPNSELYYYRKENGIRVAELKGKAFFEVAHKGPAEPFQVIAGEMVTRVLGTSFTVTAFEDDKNFSVVVKTGKVAVNTITGESNRKEAIMLDPNQQVSFSREDANFTRETLSIKEVAVHVPATTGRYVFEDTPATEVFRRIGAEYGLEIVMDEELLADCGLTTNLTDEPLFQKLGIICNSIGPATRFTIDGSRIRIFSMGCNQ
ncbi:MAG: hypothetical protein ABS46_15655 [Cytophagaceae bacterium SCN 52-12]|nr:MAG: hypothetical protein ABS46_15655 [Cytophagaceae bacterium SCN 52-12]